VLIFKVKIVILEDLKEVPHHCTPQGREGLSAYRNYLALILLAI
jgi:hypothetical protein